jgi:hypothetical protein
MWTVTDLDNELQNYPCYYDEHRTHSGRDSATPDASVSGKVVDIGNYQWNKQFVDYLICQ